MDHPADADYSDYYILSDEQLDTMLEAAIDTIDVIRPAGSGRRWRHVSGGPLPPPARVETGWFTTPGHTPLERIDEVTVVRYEGWPSQPDEPDPDPREIPTFQDELWQQAKVAAAKERIRLSAVDAALIGDLVAVTEDRVNRIRETPAAQHPVVDKALTSLCLGLLGLMKVIADESDGDAAVRADQPPG